jgi:predicted secreted protein
MLSTPTFSAIAEINSISGPNKSRATMDVTSLDSTGGYREFRASFRDPGEVQLSMNFTLATYTLLNDDFEDESPRDYQIVFPDTGETTFEFSGLVTAMGSAVPLDDKVTATVTIKITGPVNINT